MRAKQLVKQFERGIISEEECKAALLDAWNHREISEAEYKEAMAQLD